MAYTLINWDELTPINPANLNKMDIEIDSNENRVGTAETNISNNDSDIATLDNRVDGNDSEINSIDGNHDGKVDSADNADRLNGKSWVTIVSGSKSDTTGFVINLKPGGTHNHYNISAFSYSEIINFGTDEYSYYAYIRRSRTADLDDGLHIEGDYLDETAYYEVWSWE